MALAAGEVQPIEVRVGALGRNPRPLPEARLFVRDDRGRDGASIAPGLRALGAPGGA
jgi:hypothetical protein